MADWPRVTAAPARSDVVQVLMTEDMARRFEQRCLGPNTRGWTQLSPPLLFREDDVPTYIIDTAARPLTLPVSQDDKRTTNPKLDGA
jgi:hypothetical protein